MTNLIKKFLLLFSIISIAVKLTLMTAIFAYPNIISNDNISTNAQEIITLTNQYREQEGLNKLQSNARLTQAAINKAHDLLINQYFSHTSPEGKKFSQWIKEVDYKYFYVGENLAIDFTSSNEVFKAWLNSPTHKENIIKPQYQEIGVAVIEGKYKNRPTLLVVQLFGSRILGENNSSTNNYQPFYGFTENYFPTEKKWQKIVSLNNIERLNKWNNYFLIIILGLYLITYTPANKKNQINIKQPIINRYQAKIFRE